MRAFKNGMIILFIFISLAYYRSSDHIPLPDPIPRTDTIFRAPVYNGLTIRNGLHTIFNKLEHGDTVRIVYLGGSVTQANGYRLQTIGRLQKGYPAATVTGFNAGVGGTGSDLGVFRVDGEVLTRHPDLVFVEFAINDLKTDATQIRRSMEGIVRKIKTNNPATDICFLYTISSAMLNDAANGKEGNSISNMQKIAAHYGIPSINLGNNVYDSLKAGRLIFKGTKLDSATGRIVFTNDNTHPTEQGHRLYTNTIIDCFNILKEVKKATQPLPAPLTPGHYQNAISLRADSLATTGTWAPIASDPFLKAFLNTFPNMVYSGDQQDSIVIRFKGSIFGIEDVMGPTSSAVSITIDGIKRFAWNRFDSYCTSYRRSYFMIPPLANGDHRVVLRLDPQKVDKFKILHSTSPLDTALFTKSYIHIGKIMILNEP